MEQCLKNDWNYTGENQRDRERERERVEGVNKAAESNKDIHEMKRRMAFEIGRGRYREGKTAERKL